MLGNLLRQAAKKLGFWVSSFVTATYGSVGTSYQNQKKIVTLSDGSLMMITIVSGSITDGKLFRSTNGGRTWSAHSATLIAGFVNGSMHNYVGTDGVERLCVVWKQFGTGGSRIDGYMYVMVGALSSDKATITWAAAAVVTASTQTDTPDIVSHAEASGAGMAYIAANRYSGSTTNIYFYHVLITSANVCTPSTVSSVASSITGSFQFYPSIDIDPATKRLFLAWTNGATGSGRGVRARTATYTGGAPTWATEMEISTAYYVTSGGINGLISRWDASGSRWVIAGFLNNGSANHLEVWDSTTFTGFTNRINDPTVQLYGFSAAIDASGNVHFLGFEWTGTEYINLRYYKATRAGAALTVGLINVLEYFSLGTGNPSVNAKVAGTKLVWIYPHTSSPIDVYSGMLELV